MLRDSTHPSTLIQRTSNTIRPILTQLQVRHSFRVRPLIILDLFALLDVEERHLWVGSASASVSIARREETKTGTHLSRFMARNDNVWCERESAYGSL
jgi:hypothetical protein